MGEDDIGESMNAPGKTTFWIWTACASLIFLASVIFLAMKLTPSEAPWALPVYIAVFFLFFLLYFTSADRWLAGRTAWTRFLLTLILLAPILLLSFWLGLVKHDAISPLMWLAPFLGIAVGLNLRVALGKVR